MARFGTIRALGFTVGLAYLLKRAFERLSGGYVRLHVYRLVAQPVSEVPLLPPGRGRRIEVREVYAHEVAELPVDRPRSVFAERFRQGARCLVASTQGRFLGFLWFITTPYEEDEVRCRFVMLPRGRAAWDFDIFVDPSARIGLAFGRLWDEANRILSSQGVTWSISRISAFNTESLASHRKLGLRHVGTAAFLCIGPAQLTLCSMKPYFHIALSRHRRPVIPVRAC